MKWKELSYKFVDGQDQKEDDGNQFIPKSPHKS